MNIIRAQEMGNGALSAILSSEANKRLSEICGKLPDLLANRENLTLWERDIRTGMEICKKYSVEYCGEEKACFFVGLSRDMEGNLQIRATDIVYL